MAPNAAYCRDHPPWAFAQIDRRARLKSQADACKIRRETSMPDANAPFSAGLAQPVFVDNRLDSWKEIAAYLKRDIRTVQRWEKLEGLPVRRHQHQKRGSAFAYRDELDAWWKNRGHEVDAAPRHTDVAHAPH